MAASFGRDVLDVFDVWDDARDFLCQAIQSRSALRCETQQLLDRSLFAGADDWHALLQCATSIHQSRPFRPDDLCGQDVLSSVCLLLSGQYDDGPAPAKEPWHETDRLIALAQRLEHEAGTLLSLDARGGDHVKSRLPRSKHHGQSGGVTSHYWGCARRGDTDVGHPPCRLAASLVRSAAPLPRRKPPVRHSRPDISVLLGSGPQFASDQHDALRSIQQVASHSDLVWAASAAPSCRSTTSPYFSAQPASQGKKAPKRPLAGTVSCVPFPPLSSPRFGIIQEEVAHEPFWLLIAVTFLIKTSGQLAIPAFLAVRDRFPGPLQLADPANAPELSGMIRHLGLVVVRVAYIQKYARAYLCSPPRPGVRHRVKNYDKREMAPPGTLGNDVPMHEDDLQDPEAWEIGHMTRGKYALDSWRIFCRDELLGRAQDWNGKGREPEFQPEWMRVMPKDKELRAYLRWMWMREGWEWDPATGERTVLGEEMRQAVDQGRVEYDDTGGLRIIGDGDGSGDPEDGNDAVGRPG